MTRPTEVWRRWPAAAGAAALALALLALPGGARPAAAQEVIYVDDALTGPPQGAASGVVTGRQGGSFGVDGWTVTGEEDTLWYVIPVALERGRVELTVSGLSTDTNLTGALHDVLVMYATTDDGEPVGYAPFFRSNDFKTQVRVIGTGEPSRGAGASKLELRICPMGSPGYHELCEDSCGETVGSAYLNNAPMAELPWNASREYRLRVTWEPGRMTYDRDGNSVSIGFPGSYAPERLVVRLGSPRHTAGTLDRMPVGMVVKDLLVAGVPSSPAVVCGEEPSPEGPCLRGVAVDPTAGGGDYAILRATYSHCDGADAFRIVQVWVGDEVRVDVPRVSWGFENGSFGGESGSCAPGAAGRLGNLWGGLDCGASAVRYEGDEVIVDWALWFEPGTFTGRHNVYFDAKGGAGSPEPRLGWTHMGSFEVYDEDEVIEVDPDAGLADTGGTDTGAGDVGGDAAGPDAGGPGREPLPDAGGSADAGNGGQNADASPDLGEVGPVPGESAPAELMGGCGCSPDVDASAAWLVTLPALAIGGRPRRRRRR